MRRRVVVTVLLSALLVAACATAPPPQPTAEPSRATAQPAAGAAATTAPPGRPSGGDQVRVTLNQEPDNLNPYYTGMRAAFVVTQAVYNGLVGVDEKGEYQPELASEVPTLQNGGVSADGKTITYKLRRDVKWADGRPLTAEDVKFTWDAIMSPENTIAGKSVYAKIDGIDIPDEHTVVLRMKEVFAAYATYFSYPQGILPKHALGGLPDLNQAEFNRAPFGTGPYRVTEWAAANYIQLEANPNYFKGKPLLDRVTVRIVPDKNTQLAQLRANETDVAVDLSEADAVEVEKISGFKVVSQSGLASDRLFLNLAEPGVADGSQPHPILGDKRVRQALELGVNKQQIVERLLFGKTTVASSEYPIGWAAPNLPPSRHDPEAARRLLDEAGWESGPEGVRQKDGLRLKLTIASTSGNKLREDVEQLLQAGWKGIGVDLEIKNVPAAVLVGEWSANGLTARGNYDIAYFGFVPGTDPSDSVSIRFHSRELPSEENDGDGGNLMRYQDEEVDGWIEGADGTLDLGRRKELYGNVMRKVAEDVPIIYLYNRANVEAVSQRLQGVRGHPFRWLTWNIHEWSRP